MAIDKKEAEDLTLQVRDAHRLIAGFYQRMLPAVENLATEFGCTFWNWRPEYFQRPSHSRTYPGTKAVWDLLPTVAMRFSYNSETGASATVGDLWLDIYVSIEPVLEGTERNKLGLVPDADSMGLPESSTAKLVINGYKVFADSASSLADCYNAVDHPQSDHDRPHRLSNNIEGVSLSFPLAEFISDPKTVKRTIADRLAFDLKDDD